MKKNSRRTFIRDLSLGAVMLHPGMAPFYTMRDSMQLGLVTYLWGKDWDVPTIIKNCKAANILGVELRTEHAHGVDPGLSPTQQQEVRQRFADSPVTLVGLGTNQDYHHPDQAKLRASIDRTKEFIRLSQAVGGSGVKVKPNAIPKEVPVVKTIEQIGSALNEVASYAADFGQEIRVEVHGEVTQELPVLKSILDVADHPNVKVCWNCNDQDLWGDGLKANFELVRDRFGATVHVRELNIGPYPYQDLMGLLVKSRYQGWILLECRTDPADKVRAMQEQYTVFKEMIRKVG